MARDCKVRIKIGDGAIQDAQATWRFHLMNSPDMIVAPQRDYEVENYPEVDGSLIYPYTSKEPFDYKLTFCFFGDIDTTNNVIADFYDSLFETESGTDRKKAKELTIYNDYKNVIIVGYAKNIETNDYMVEARNGVVLFDLTIYVAEPKKCNFKP